MQFFRYYLSHLLSFIQKRKWFWRDCLFICYLGLVPWPQHFPRYSPDTWSCIAFPVSQVDNILVREDVDLELSWSWRWQTQKMTSHQTLNMFSAKKLLKISFFIIFVIWLSLCTTNIHSRLQNVNTSLNIVTESLIPFKQALCMNYTDNTLYSING